MKKLFIISVLVMVSMLTFGQTKEWNWTLSVDNAIDTVVQPGKTWDLSGYRWSGTLVFTGLADTVKIGIGGSNNLIRATPSYQYAIENIPVTPSTLAFPYNFIPSAQQVITVNDTTYQQSWYSGNDPLSFKGFGVSLETTGDTVFTVNGYFIFNK